MPDASPAYLPHHEILPIVRGVALCILLAAVDQTIVVPAVPRMAAALHADRHLPWLVTAYLLTGTAATPVFGKLSDIYGRCRLMQFAVILFVLASLGCALATNLPEMAVLRGIQGVGGAGLMTLAQISMADVIPPRERGRYQIYMSGMWGLASLGAPALGGLLTDMLSWRAIFWINLPLGVIAYGVSSRALAPLSRPNAGEGRVDYAGAFLLMLVIAALLLLISGGGRDFPWFSAPAAELGGTAILGLALAIWQERNAPAPVLPPRIFGNGVVSGGMLLSFCNALCMFGATLLLPLYFQYSRHSSAGFSGLCVTPFMLSFVSFSYVGGQISRMIGHTKPTILMALLACLLGLLLLATMGPQTPLALAMVYMILLGAGIGLIQPNITVTIQNAAERADVAVATGCMLLFRSIGGASGATLAGTVMLAYGFRAAFLTCAACALVAIAVAGGMRDQTLRSAA